MTEIENKMAEVERLKKQSDAIVQQNPMPILLMDKDLKVMSVQHGIPGPYRIFKGTGGSLTITDFRYSPSPGRVWEIP